MINKINNNFHPIISKIDNDKLPDKEKLRHSKTKSFEPWDKDQRITKYNNI